MSVGKFARRAAPTIVVVSVLLGGCGNSGPQVGRTESATVHIDSCAEVSTQLHGRLWRARDLAPPGWPQPGRERGMVRYTSKTEAAFTSADGSELKLWQGDSSNFECRSLGAN